MDAEAQESGQPSAAFPDHMHGAGLEVEHPVLELKFWISLLGPLTCILIKVMCRL